MPTATLSLLSTILPLRQIRQACTTYEYNIQLCALVALILVTSASQTALAQGTSVDSNDLPATVRKATQECIETVATQDLGFESMINCRAALQTANNAAQLGYFSRHDSAIIKYLAAAIHLEFKDYAYSRMRINEAEKLSRSMSDEMWPWIVSVLELKCDIDLEEYRDARSSLNCYNAIENYRVALNKKPKGYWQNWHGHYSSLDRRHIFPQRMISLPMLSESEERSHADLPFNYPLRQAALSAYVGDLRAAGRYFENSMNSAGALTTAQNAVPISSVYSCDAIVEAIRILGSKGLVPEFQRKAETIVGAINSSSEHRSYALSCEIVTMREIAKLHISNKNHDVALDILRSSIGKNATSGSPDLWLSGTIHETMALIEMERGNKETAISNLLLAHEEYEQHLTGTDWPPWKVDSMLDDLRDSEERVYSLLLLMPDNPDLQRLATRLILRRKGSLTSIDASISQALAINNERNGPNQGRIDRERLGLLNVQKEYGDFQILCLSHQTPTERCTAEMQGLKTVIQGMARRIARKTVVNVGLPKFQSTIFEEVKSAVGNESALVEFVKFRRSSFAESILKSNTYGDYHYFAIAIATGGLIRVVDVGKAETIERYIGEFLDRSSSPRTDARLAAEHLFRAVWHPIEPAVKGAHRVMIAPDDSLSLIPFDALFDGQKYLIERYQLQYLSSGRDLLRSFTKRAAAPPLILADPDFRAAAPVVLIGPAAVSKTEATASISAGGGERPATLRAISELAGGLSALPGTRREARRLQALLPRSQLYLGEAATEAQLRRPTAPSILHIATHGAFLSDSRAADAPLARSALSRLQSTSNEPGLEQTWIKRVTGKQETASALLLAGAATDRAVDSREDGVLLAEEVQSMNYWGTQLAVLSACETGRGAVRIGQGVYGLRRAFLVAGVETLVSSLWKVDDAATSELMVDFYKQILRGTPRLGALRMAMLKAKQRRPHPYYWAAFVGIGRDAPVVGLSRARH